MNKTEICEAGLSAVNTACASPSPQSIRRHAAKTDCKPYLRTFKRLASRQTAALNSGACALLLSDKTHRRWHRCSCDVYNSAVSLLHGTSHSQIGHYLYRWLNEFTFVGSARQTLQIGQLQAALFMAWTSFRVLSAAWWQVFRIVFALHATTCDVGYAFSKYIIYSDASRLKHAELHLPNEKEDLRSIHKTLQ